jgi:hypothetical protein
VPAAETPATGLPQALISPASSEPAAPAVGPVGGGGALALYALVMAILAGIWWLTS